MCVCVYMLMHTKSLLREYIIRVKSHEKILGLEYKVS